MQTRTVLGLSRTRAGVLSLVCALTFLACAIDGGSKSTRDSVPQQQWNSTRGPVVPHDTFPRDCSICHEGSSWQKIRSDFVFDHDAETGTPLLGAHARAECLRCHNDRGPVEQFAQRGCVGCHEDVHLGRLGPTCTTCHEPTSIDWRPKGAIAKHSQTRFPLVGVHASTACWACHPGAQVGNFYLASTTCYDCHSDQYLRATQPNHVSNGFSTSCERCHKPTSWGDGAFDHSEFPISNGPHSSLSCQQCHPSPNSFRQFTCVSCHAHSMSEMNDEHDDVRNYKYVSSACYQCHPDGQER